MRLSIILRHCKKFLFAVLFSLGLVSTTFGQGIVGASTVQVGQLVTYSYDEGALLSAANWVITNGTKGTPTRVGTVYSIPVTWSTAGTGSVKLQAKESGHTEYYTVATKSITILSAPPTPIATFSPPNYQCGKTSITRSATPTGVPYDWFWQTSPTGTDISSTAAAITRDLTSSSPLYLRARFKGTPNTWSVNSQAVPGGTITVYTTPNKPASATNGYRFGPGEVSLSVSQVAGATSYKWYFANTPSTDFLAGVTSHTYVVNLDQRLVNYYVSTISGPCESTSRTLVSGNLFDKPVIVVSGTGLVSPTTPVTLSTSTSYDTYT